MGILKRENLASGGLSRMISEAESYNPAIVDFFTKRCFEPRNKCSQCNKPLSIYNLDNLCSSCREKSSDPFDPRQIRLRGIDDRKISMVIDAFAEAYNVSADNIKKSRRGMKGDLPARNLAIYFSIVFLERNRHVIAKYFGASECHILTHVKKAEELIRTDKKIRELVNELKEEFNLPDASRE